MVDINKYLILIMKKFSTEFEDCTKNIVNITKLPNGYSISFEHGKKTEFFYDKSKVIIYENPYFRNADNIYIKYKDMYLNSIEKMLKFGPYIRVFYKNGKDVLYNACDITFLPIKSIEKDDLYHYLSEILNVVKPQGDVEDGISVSLTNGIKNISQIQENCFLYHMLFEKIEHISASYNNLIYPFMANAMQRKAVENALANRISIIEGPPGTGKTSTILNIMANLIVNNKSVAMVSSKNEAVKNVYDKLLACNYEYLVAECGRKDIKENFFNSKQIPIENILSRLEEENYDEKGDFDKVLLYNQLQAIDEEKSKLMQTLSDLEVEYKVYLKEINKAYDEIPIKYRKRLKANPLTKIAIIKYAKDNNKNRFFLIRKFRCWINKNEYKNINLIGEYLHLIYYYNEIKLLNQKINKLNTKLEKGNYSKLKEEINDIYNKQFKSYLFRKYKKMDDFSFTCSGLWNDRNDFCRNFEKFINKYPIVTSTTFSLQKSKVNGYLFDYLIIDEASQADIMSTLIAFSMAKNVVIIGDSKQLDMVISDDNKKLLSEIFKKYSLESCYDYSDNNALSMCKRRCSDPRFTTLINEHFRCDPYIISFCNKRFYNGELIIRTKHDPDSVVKVIKTSGYQSSTINTRQIDEINELVSQIQMSELEKSKENPTYKIKNIGIISPFIKQVDLINKSIVASDIKVDTVHKFQGRENDIIIISTVKRDILDKDDFLNRKDLINVALTRAKKSLYLLVSDNLASNDNSIIYDFIKYQELINQDFTLEYGRINSIFDMMYKNYDGVYKKIFGRLDGKHKENSEDIVGTILNKFVLINDINHYDYVHNYKLALLVPKIMYQDLDDEEIDFINTRLSHVDFLIYNTVTKRPICAIEVDGIQHKIDPKQVKRDKLKNSILIKMKLPLIRYSTRDNITPEKIKEDVLNYI